MMLDGRKSILWALPFALALTACGEGGDVGAAIADEATPTAEEPQSPAPEVTPEPTSDEETETDLEPIPTPSACDGENAPARCDADPQTYDEFGAAGVITSLELLDDENCCVDFDGDDRPDNALGQGFSDIQKLDQLNEELANSLVNGAQTILLELVGGQNDQTVTLNVYGGQQVGSSPESGPQVALDPASIDRGVAPLFTFDSAQVIGDRLLASQGEMELEASFNGVLLKPTVHDLQLDARIESRENGLVLRDGEVGGRIELSQIHGEINAVAAGCDCLNLDQPLVLDGVCATPAASTCEAEGRETCAALAEVCPVLEIIASNIADVDADQDGTPDSISLGAIFETEAAQIAGVMQ